MALQETFLDILTFLIRATMLWVIVSFAFCSGVLLLGAVMTGQANRVRRIEAARKHKLTQGGSR